VRTVVRTRWKRKRSTVYLLNEVPFMTNLQTNLMKKGVQVLVQLDLLKESSDAAIWELGLLLGMRRGFPGARTEFNLNL
jgi:hypothetical protein